MAGWGRCLASAATACAFKVVLYSLPVPKGNYRVVDVGGGRHRARAAGSYAASSSLCQRFATYPTTIGLHQPPPAPPEPPKERVAWLPGPPPQPSRPGPPSGPLPVMKVSPFAMKVFATKISKPLVVMVRPLATVRFPATRLESNTMLDEIRISVLAKLR